MSVRATTGPAPHLFGVPAMSGLIGVDPVVLAASAGVKNSGSGHDGRRDGGGGTPLVCSVLPPGGDTVSAVLLPCSTPAVPRPRA